MKKNITINLFGSLFAIDEDAYELLKKYEESIRAYFSKQEGGNEIADDIERRIAELFGELKEQGIEAISIEHVQDIIKRIGDPEQMETGENEEKKQSAQSPQQKSVSKKKLFRDPNDQMLGGVMSGLSHYFGGDVLLWRLLAIILCLFTSFTILLVYIAMWIIIPQARTTEDFLLMNGQEVTPDNIAQTIMDSTSTQKATKPARTGFDSILGVGVTIFKILLYITASFFVLIFACCLIGLICVAILALGGFISFGSFFAVFDSFNADTILFLPGFCSYSFWILIIAGMICSIAPIYCVVHHFLRLRNKVKPMGITQRIVWVTVWVISIGAIIASATMLNNGFEIAYKNRSKDRKIQRIESNAPKYKIWKKCYKAFSKSDSRDAAIWAYDDETIQYSYEEFFSNLAPGVYRFTTRALSDTNGSFFRVDINRNSSSREICSGTPRKIYELIKSGQDRTSSAFNAAVINSLPECTIDSVVLTRPTTVKCSIVTGDVIHLSNFAGSYIVHAPKFKIEKLESKNPPTGENSWDGKSDKITING